MPYGKFGPGYCITFIKRLDGGPELATFRTKTLNFFRVIHLNWLAKFELRGPVPPCQYNSQLLLYVKKTCTQNKGVPLPAGKAYAHYSMGL